MSALKTLFGNKKKKKRSTPPTENAIEELRSLEEIMAGKQENLVQQIEHEVSVAKQNAKTNKRVALQALKRKKLYEQKLSNIDNTVLTLEQQRESLESAAANTTILNTMKYSADTLKSTHKNMSIEDVNEIMDDISEAQDISKEWSNAISNLGTNGIDVDEDELLKELEELNLQEHPVTNVFTPPVPTFDPNEKLDRPKNTRSKTNPKNNDELSILADWAS